jgi:hypothetical protein
MILFPHSRPRMTFYFGCVLIYLFPFPFVIFALADSHSRSSYSDDGPHAIKAATSTAIVFLGFYLPCGRLVFSLLVACCYPGGDCPGVRSGRGMVAEDSVQCYVNCMRNNNQDCFRPQEKSLCTNNTCTSANVTVKDQSRIRAGMNRRRMTSLTE